MVKYKNTDITPPEFFKCLSTIAIYKVHNIQFLLVYLPIKPTTFISLSLYLNKFQSIKLTLSPEKTS